MNRPPSEPRSAAEEAAGAAGRHPPPERLAEHAAGRSDRLRRAMVEAHLALCERCSERVDELAGVAGTGTLAGSCGMPLPADLFDRVLAAVDRYERDLPAEASHVPARALAELDLPAAPWRWVELWPTGARVARIAHDAPSGADLFVAHYRAGSRFPRHTHLGLEENVILAGGYLADGRWIATGDWLEGPVGTAHAPRTDPGEECWCLSRIEAPGARLHGIHGVGQRLAESLARRRRG